MKTLNEYIKESLLDNEEELIGRAEETANNWLLTLKRAMLDDEDEECIEKIINRDKVKKEISKIFYKFDGRMKWLCGKYSGASGKSVYCILKDTKERTKYPPKPALSFMLWGDKEYVHIEIADINQLSKTARKNVKPTELLKFKQYLLDMGAEYSKTGSGKIQEDTLKI